MHMMTCVCRNNFMHFFHNLIISDDIIQDDKLMMDSLA